MKIAAVIAEYNPFHNGHSYQLQTIRQQLCTDYIIVVMSGDFMQRGIPAIMDKYDRCRMALENGADIVFELPAYFSLGSAEYFAAGAVSLLDKLGVVDFLHFGSECGDIDILTSCASVLTNESDTYQYTLNNALKEGKSFPTARAIAINSTSKNIPNLKNALDSLLTNPNNILGIEYIKALLQRNSSITPVTISRIGEEYNSSALISGTFASANAIRELLKNIHSSANTNQLLTLSEFVPDSIYYEIYNKLSVAKNTFSAPFVFTDDFSQLLRYKLLSELQKSQNQLSNYYDVTQQLANTFYKNIDHFTTFSDFASVCKSKNLTYTRISRCLMHILLDMKQDAIDTLKANDYSLYARLLGFNERGKNILKHIKANASIPIISKLPKALKEFDKIALISLKADIYASTIYQSVHSAHLPFPNEMTREIIKVTAQ